MTQYTIRFSVDPNVNLYEAEAQYPQYIRNVTLKLNDDQLAGLYTGLSFNIYPFGWLEISDAYGIIDNGKIDRMPWAYHFIGSGEAKDILEEPDFHKRLDMLATLYYGGTVDLEKRYILIYQSNDYISAQEFDRPEFLQGIITGCQWLNKDCRTVIKLYDQNGNELEYL